MLMYVPSTSRLRGPLFANPQCHLNGLYYPTNFAAAAPADPCFVKQTSE